MTNNNIPKLRFPEFWNGWEMKKLREIVKINQGLQIAISERLTEQIEGSHFYITNEFLKANSEKKYFIKNPPLSVLCTTDDILMTRTGNTGMVVINVEGAFHNNFFKVAFPNYIDRIFLYNFLKLPKTQNQILKMAGTSTIPDLNHSDFYRIILPYPALLEQQKIATFLSIVDEKLQTLKKKKSLLETYKKGVMQKLFSQERNAARIRFKDDEGNDFEDWEMKRLGEVTQIYDGTHQTPNYVEEGIPFYSVEQLTANDFSKTKFVTKEVFDKENQRVKLQKGDILMTRIGDIGTSRFIDWEVNASFYVSIVLIKQSPSFNSKYIHHFIGTKFFQNELWSRTIHVAFPKKINLGEIGNCKLYLPCKKEQTKIANFLTAIDEKINKVDAQIKQTELWKKGLLQGMFC